MAMEMKQSRPICQDTQVCLGCVLQRTQRNPVCPLCRRTIVTVLFSDQGEETSITVPGELPEASSQGGRAPVASRPSSLQDTPFQAMGGLLPEVWAELFRQKQPFLDPVWTWLRQRMETMYGEQWWLRESTQSCIVHFLCTYGPDEELMIQSLQDILEEHTVPLVQDIINIIRNQCSERAQRLLLSHAARDEDDSPAASSSSGSSSSSSQMGTPSNSSTVSVEVGEAGTMQAALSEGHSCSPPVPVPLE